LTRSIFLSLFLRIALALAVFAVVEVDVPRLRGWPGAVLGMVLAGVVAWWMVRSLQATIGPLEGAAMRIGDAEAAEVRAPEFSDFDALAQALRVASGQVRRTLAQTAESRHDLEALLDSMQDAVVAVDASGRILWTNQKMQRLMLGPGGNLSASGMRWCRAYGIRMCWARWMWRWSRRW
jgi:two-component system phosphate regulon sensor histidine kinase PhoR